MFLLWHISKVTEQTPLSEQKKMIHYKDQRVIRTLRKCSRPCDLPEGRERLLPKFPGPSSPSFLQISKVLPVAIPVSNYPKDKGNFPYIQTKSVLFKLSKVAWP